VGHTSHIWQCAEGSTGILVEEHIKRELRKIGYMDPVATTQEAVDELANDVNEKGNDSEGDDDDNENENDTSH
jgi:hypothetical protein